MHTPARPTVKDLDGAPASTLDLGTLDRPGGTDGSVAITPDGSIDAETAAICKALGHPMRVRLLRRLLENDTCVFGSLAGSVPLAPSTVVQHLSQLKAAALVEQWDEGQNSRYRVNRDRLDLLRSLLARL